MSDQTQHMTKTEAHPYHYGSSVPVRDIKCPLCRKDFDLLSKHLDDEHWEGPFVTTQYVSLPGDRLSFVAQCRMTGICCAGRESRELSQDDERALNAAFRWGCEVGAYKARTATHQEALIHR